MGRQRILVVEDEADIFDVIHYNLTREGFLVVGAPDGHEGLRLARLESPDLVLLDLRLPDIDGFEVLESIRANVPSSPVVVITAYASIDVAVRAVRMGAEDLLAKPFKPDQIRVTVRNALRKSLLDQQVQHLRTEVDDLFGHRVVLGDSPAAQTLKREIDVTALYELERVRFVAPRLEPDGSMTIRLYDPGALVRHPYGFNQPNADADRIDERDIDVVLLPGLVFDKHGGRLGRGGGYYDRLLARIPQSTARIGVTSRRGVVDEVPMDDHDQRVDWLVTESSVDWAGHPLDDSTRRVMRSCIANGIAPRMQGFPEGTRTSSDAARAVGCELGAIAKSLVFEVDGTPVLVLCSGDRRVDETKLASLRGGSVASPASRARVLDITGYPAGGTPAMGHHTPLDVVADSSLARYRVVWSAGGTVETVYPVTLERLVSASAAQWADVSTRG